MHQNFDYEEPDGEKLSDQLQKFVDTLVTLGLAEQLIGEDGNFYYRLTDKGSDFVRDITGDSDNG